MLLRVVSFLLVFAGAQLAWQAASGTALDRVVIQDATVRPAEFLINALTPETHVRAVGSSLEAPGGGLNILNGCEGVESLFLLFAAFVVAPIPWRSRIRGLLTGIALVFALNQARILLLFYAYRADHALFDPLHSVATPLAMVVAIAAYFYAWLAHAGRGASAVR